MQVTLNQFKIIRGFQKLNIDKHFETHEDTFDFVTKDEKVFLSKNKKIAGNQEKEKTPMGVYLTRFCDSKKLNVYEFLLP